MKKIRITTDSLMIIALPLLMAYSLIGENTHEIIGICMLVLFLTHHMINRKWWGMVFKGRYNPSRILSTAVNLFLAVFMVLQPITGILMSKYVLKGVTISGAAGILRTIHMPLAYWGFIIMSLHLGLHVRSIGASLGKHMSTAARNAVRAGFLLMSLYGIYAFVKRGIGDYLLMKVMFAFYDFSEPRVWFFIDYVAVMIFVANIGFYLQGALLRITGRRKQAI